jgi:nucleotide-binding universal stress UspA family protein
MTSDQPAIRTIVVAVGPRFWDDPVLPAAFGLAKRLGARLHAVRAFDPPGVAPGDQQDPRERIARRQADMLAGLQGQVETFGAGVAVTCHVVTGSPDEVVASLARSEHADLVAVGAARMENLTLRLLGTKAERIIAHSPVPVLVLRTPIEPPVRRILVAVDPSAAASRVFDQARAVVAGSFGDDAPEYRVLRVIWEQDAPAAADDDRVATVTDELQRFLDERGARDTQPIVRAGLPAGVILAEARAWPADLVVLGTSARTTAERLIMGSVSASVLRDLQGNALVIPAAAMDPA